MTPDLYEVEHYNTRARMNGRANRKAWRLTTKTMTEQDRNIVEALWRKLEQEHRGLRHAIRGEDLAKHFAVPYNTIRQCVFYLVETKRVPIGTALSGKPRGYFIIETAEEAQHSLAIPRARATENWAYHHALARAVKEALNIQVEQLRLGM